MSVALLTVCMLESLPWKTFFVCSLIFCVVVFARSVGNDERKKFLAKKKIIEERRAKRNKELEEEIAEHGHK